MLIRTVSQADFGRKRLRIDHPAIVIVLLLSLLFAAAIVSALAPHPLPEAETAALQGGL